MLILNTHTYIYIFIFSLGVDYPRDYDLPSPRLISNKLFATDKLKFDRKKTAELMAWGQLLAHDIILTPLIDGKYQS